MTPVEIGVLGIILMVALFFCGVPIGFSMGIVGFLGFSYLNSLDTAVSVLGSTIYNNFSDYNLSILPLFLLMGQFAFLSGLSRDIYSAAHKWLARLPGGVAMATIGGCAGFAAICGSSAATAATMAMVAYPEMKELEYDPGLATGSIAAGGTLGILIPPSTAFVVYGIVTQTSIGKLLIAGFLPGVLLAVLFILTIYLLVRMNPSWGPQGPRFSLKDKLLSIKDAWGVLMLFIVVIGGLYIGIFTPTEGAAIGAFLAFVIALGRKALSWKDFQRAGFETIATSVMIFIIIFGASVFGYFLALTQIPVVLSQFIVGLHLSRYIVLVFIVAMYLILGCIMEAYSMIILTLPILFPIITALGFDPIWYGVIMVIMIEQALITPPVGMNLFVMQGVAKDVPLFAIARGAVPFVVAMLVCVVLLAFFPQIALFLPTRMK